MQAHYQPSRGIFSGFVTEYQRQKRFAQGALALLLLCVVLPVQAVVKPQIAGGVSLTIALKSDGTVWQWGTWKPVYNSITPVQAAGLTDITQVAAGNLFAVALKADGTVWHWGALSGTNPNQVSELSGVVQIAVANQSGFALKSDGTVWAWGENKYGQLGDGTTTTDYRRVPAQIPGLTGVVKIISGNFGSNIFAIKNDGTVWAWGVNWQGQYGNGTTTNSLIPIQISTLAGFSQITTTVSHSLGLKSDGTVWAWGGNSRGKLGDGTTINRSTPAQLSGLTNVYRISSGYYSNFALKTDGTVWAWGSSASGLLGDGTTTDRYTPVQSLINLGTYTLNVSKTGVGSVTSDISGINCGSDCSEAYLAMLEVKLTATADTGYQFSSWGGDCSGTNPVTTVKMDNIKNCTAVFGGLTYPITPIINPTGAGTLACTPNPVEHGKNSTCTVTANPGYQFSNFSGDCSGATCVLSNVTANKTVTANFTLIPIPKYNISVNTTPGAGGSVMCTPNPVEHGKDSTCTAMANAGYTFSNFSDGCSGATCVLSNVMANKTVTANFTLIPIPKYNISVNTMPGVGGSVMCTPNPVEHGKDSTCTAMANAGYTFSNFSDGCSGATCVLSNVMANKTVTANFHC